LSFLPLVILGTSDDGPDGVLQTPVSFAQAENQYGWWQREWQTITPLQSSGAVSFPIWGNLIEAYQQVDGYLFADTLYNFTIQSSGDYFTFGQPGASGYFLFKYARYPDDDNLILPYYVLNSYGVTGAALYRAPGSISSVTIGDLTLSAPYGGSKYNGIMVTVAVSSMTIWFPLDSYGVGSITYSLPQYGSTLVQAINMDSYANRHPLTATCFVTNPSIPVGTYYTTGGLNGTIDSNSIVNILASLDLDSIGIILIAGNPATGTVASALSYINSLDYSPSCAIVSGIPASYSTAPASDMANAIQGMNFKDNSLFLVPGWGLESVMPVNDYMTPLSYTFSALWNSHSSSPTNKPTYLTDMYPYWSAVQIDTLGASCCVFNNFIRNGLSPWRSSPTNGENPLITKVKHSLEARLENALEYMVGSPPATPSAIYQAVATALTGLENVSYYDFSISVGIDVVDIAILVKVYGETQSLQMNISVNRTT
jgi:hypothetical protein